MQAFLMIIDNTHVKVTTSAKHGSIAKIHREMSPHDPASTATDPEARETTIFCAKYGDDFPFRVGVKWLALPLTNKRWT
jgi:hypothetical protein